MKISVVVGTRPELIKMAVFITELKRMNSTNLYIHSGQHYDYHMDGMVADIFQLPEADYNLGVGSGSHANTTANIMIKMEEIIVNEKMDLLVVHGDTNTTLAACLAAAKLSIPIAHVEAGLRSRDPSMPEEINRILVDHMSTFRFAPTQEAVENLKKEGIVYGVYLVGQSIVDAIDYIKNMKTINNVLNKYELEKQSYFFLTIHRQENTDNPTRLSSIFSAMHALTKDYNHQLVISMHPRTKKILLQQNMLQSLFQNKRITLLDPPPNFYETIQLQQHAKLVITDSGGLQEESCIIGTPCITLRENTERPETVECGANILAGYQKGKILLAVEESLASSPSWNHPYGLEGVSMRMLDILTKNKSDEY
ncbi:non-hydrolyzing UDP-N-acetylglucosamine 2-epimerase [Sutcliffiella rhizosphaerae]|uniref:UDP-2,3-diacetamido-2,3-dideoxy-D-glucuronate 2-epimerase n=1 Tax=Sutcliffiella rhizosphaerae TaxID=2880967 RepID=A0ABN8AFG6_9BACI|nr:UDP-N-acetylglucosamine 2-epimerase (non-hydrolyzing) [Sutcliffiella rhizosphaerae]CAG9622821.1 UDP-2,3-diacetamido-2,3-dideoxy-D-glucuronate 2-epimerase [Sutcliffiella rhizosphaerae]